MVTIKCDRCGEDMIEECTEEETYEITARSDALSKYERNDGLCDSCREAYDLIKAYGKRRYTPIYRRAEEMYREGLSKLEIEQFIGAHLLPVRDVDGKKCLPKAGE